MTKVRAPWIMPLYLIDRGGAHAGVDAFAAGLGQDDLHPPVVHEMIDRTGGVTSPPTQAIR